MAMVWYEKPDNKKCCVEKRLYDDVCSVEEDIKNKVNALPKDGLTEDAVLAALENALKPYESNPKILDTIQCRSQIFDKPVLSITPTQPAFTIRFDVNEDQSRVALLTLSLTQRIRVFEETARGKEWNKIFSVNRPYTEEEKILYMRLIDNGKKLVWFDKHQSAHILTIKNEPGQSSDSDAKEIAQKCEDFLSKEYSPKDDSLYFDDEEDTRWWPAADDITITRYGFKVNYKPTLREIAQFIVNKKQQAASASKD